MQRVFVLSVMTVLIADSSVDAGPLALQPPTAQFVPTISAGAPVNPAAAPGPNLGGGFIEMLLGGRRRLPMQPSYEPAPAVGYQQDIGLEPGTPDIDPRYLRQEVRYDGKEVPGTIVINTNERMLYLVQPGGTALRYGIGVGRPGFTWAGVHHVTNKREWPDWTPPDEMLKRRPDLPRHMAGGPDNPLGARAMYLGSTLYRIHGSNEPWTIGTQVSSGCIRMRNEDVVDLYDRVKVGTKVIVI
jgi:lipoprotein-anchoring transpeptidase ErfK/SrfK